MEYKFKVLMVHTFEHEEEVELCFCSDMDLNAAHEQASHDARLLSNPSSFEAEFNGSGIEEVVLISGRPEEGEEEIPIRCDKTRDMFQ